MNDVPDTGWFVVSIHDVAPATFAATEAWTRDLERRGVPCTLLVVPGPWRTPVFAPDDELSHWLHDRRTLGDEIALHGWTHRAERETRLWRRTTGWVAARGCAELWTIDAHEAARRLRLGRALLREAGFDPIGVTPPGWLAARATVRTMQMLGFAYTTSHRGVLDLLGGRMLAAPALCHRPGAVGERLGRAVVERGVQGRARRHAPVRLGLHPDDLSRPGLRDATLRSIDGALDAGMRATTYERLVA